MQVRVDVYTKDMDAAVEAFQKAIKAGAHDFQFQSIMTAKSFLI